MKRNTLDQKYKDFTFETETIAKEIEILTKKYKAIPNSLLKDYDNIITKALICIIANFNVTNTLRDDIITQIDILIRNREFIIKNYGNNSSSNNNK